MKVKAKIILYISSIIIVCTCFTSLANADPTVIIDSYNLSPSILMPGDTGTLTLTVKNAETTNTFQSTSVSDSYSTIRTDTVGATIENIWIVAASDGSHRVKATLNYEDVGDLAPASSIDISFKLIAEDNITEGLYFPVARVDVESYEDVSYPIPVTVSNATVNLLLTDVPSRISKSGATLVTLTAVNSRKNSVDDVTIIPSSNDGLEFSPNSVFVGTLESGDSSEKSFSIKPLELGTYNLSFTVQFKNGDNVHTEQITETIEVVETSDVAPILYSIPTTIEKGKSTRISLEVFNAKTESITGVIVKPITEATIIPTQYYIGAMDSDDVFSATFDLYTDDIDYGNYTVEFQVSYKQDNEIYETPTISSSFTVVPTEDNNVNRGYILPVGIIASAIVSIVLFFKYKKRRRNGK
jgi:hypothetical protein